MKGFCHPDDYDHVLALIKASEKPDTPLEADYDVKRGTVYFLPTKTIWKYMDPPV